MQCSRQQACRVFASDSDLLLPFSLSCNHTGSARWFFFRHKKLTTPLKCFSVPEYFVYHTPLSVQIRSSPFCFKIEAEKRLLVGTFGTATGICAMRSIAVALFVLGIPSTTHCEAFTPASVIAGGGAARGGGCRGGRCGRVLGQKTGMEEGKGRAGVALRAHDDKVAFAKGKGAAGPLFDFPWKKGDPSSEVCPDALAVLSFSCSDRALLFLARRRACTSPRPHCTVTSCHALCPIPPEGGRRQGQ